MIAHKPSAEILSAGQVNFFFRPPSRYSRSAATAALDMMRRWGADGVVPTASSKLAVTASCGHVAGPSRACKKLPTYLPDGSSHAKLWSEFSSHASSGKP